MFEKSLYDLIRGLRNHKGREREYIQESLRECRQEIKSQDMDVKGTAVLKLTYLEMFGHDMSWASFNILEVMSSPKYNLKRIGYLGAVQSFRPDTEVLMLAENLLKKDLMSPQIPTINLPLVAIPHVISPSMANSLLSDLMPRLTHSTPFIRKKAIVTLYRLALVYPETLRPAWPKIKERLLDENEDPSVTAAVVNVVCELGWRRPHDFLPLAPRLFTLLVEGSNNWMAIKIIKLFATLTPLEPRLVNKLLPPITNLIRTTPAMSLLYECINGIIQGGILESAQGTTKGDEMARLCVSKLRGMLVAESDPNLKYVALLAFNKIVELHPYLVTGHEDVVMECIDDMDISIRFRALDLVVGMVNPQNLTSVVDRLMAQLHNAPLLSSVDDPTNDRGTTESVVPRADLDESDAEQSIRPGERRSNQPPPLPEDYRRSVIQRILEMCSRSTYANINDFDWYINVLVQLVRCVPPLPADAHGDISKDSSSQELDMAYQIGSELRNIAVRVKGSRAEATRAAESLVSIDQRESLFPPSGNGGISVLGPVVWIVGEFANLLANPAGVLNSLEHSSTARLPGSTLSVYIQASVKIYVFLAGDDQQSWTSDRKDTVSQMTTKFINFLEPLTSSPNLEVQERAVEYLELARLANEAIDGQAASSDYSAFADPPLLLAQAIPALFTGTELNPVAKDAQRKVPLPEDLDLEKPISDNLQDLLRVPDFDTGEDDDDEFHQYYTQRPQTKAVVAEPAANRLPDYEFSYQQSNGDELDPEANARRKADRKERYRDDPFYIAGEGTSGRGTPTQNIIRANDGEELDVDSIPVMELDLDADDIDKHGYSDSALTRKPRRKVEILADETVEDADSSSSGLPSGTGSSRTAALGKLKRSPLQVDSSGLGSLSLEGNNTRGGQLDIERREAEEAEMAEAMKEVERLRLQMQRDAERIEVVNGPAEGVVVKKKKKKKKPAAAPDADVASVQGEDAVVKKKKKKSARAVEATEQATENDQEAASASVVEAPAEEAVVAAKGKKKKIRRQILFEEDTPSQDAA